MKKIILFFLSVPYFMSGQTFYKTTTIASSTNITAAKSSDTSFVFSPANNTFAKADKNGILSWQKQYTLPSAIFASNDLTPISDTTFCSPSIMGGNGGMLILNGNGVLKTAKSYTLSGPLYRVQTTAGNNLIFLGYNTSTFPSHVTFTKTDINGNVITSKKILHALGNNTAQPTFSFVKMNSNLFVASYKNIQAPAIHNLYDIITVAIDSSLNVLWTNQMGGNSEDVPVYGISSGGNYYLLSRTSSFTVPFQNMLITCMNSSGSAIWSRIYGKAGYEIWPEHLSIASDSSLIISGFVRPGAVTGNEKGFFAKITKQGDFVTSNIYNPSTGYSNQVIKSTFALDAYSLNSLFYSTQITPTTNYIGIMRMNQSGSLGCQDTAFFLEEKNVALTFQSYPVISTLISPVATNHVGTTASTAFTATAVCANACTTAAGIDTVDTRICFGTILTFTSNSYNYSSLDWLINGVNMGNTISYSHTFNIPGIHLIELIANGGSCSDTARVYVTVDSMAVSNFSFVQQGLNGEFINLSVQNHSNTWLMGNGNVFSSLNLSYDFSEMGTYNNCLVVANACNTDTLCQLFYAYDYSNFTFSADYDFPDAVPGKAWGNSICQNTRGNLVLLASDIEGFSSVDDDLVLIEINKTGQIIKQAIVYTYGDEMPKKIIPVGSRGYIVLSQNIPLSKGVISFTDTAFTGIYSYAGTNLLVNDAYAANDSSFYIAASHSPFGMLLKLDKYFNLIWSKRFISAKEIRRITLLNDGNLLLSGKSSSSNAYMCKLNPATGQVIWSKTYSSFSGTDGFQTAEDGLGNLYLTGNVAGSPYRSFILKTDQNGVMQWQRLFAGSSTSLVGNYCAVNQFDDLYFFHYSNTIPNYITKLDLAGNVMWTKDYDIRADGTTLAPTAGVMCMDGGIAITGTSAFGPNEDIFVIKTDTSGITNSCNVSIPPTTVYTAGITETTNTTDSTINFGITYTSFSYLSGTMLYTPDIVCSGNSCASMVNYTYTNTGLTFNFDQDAFGFPSMQWDFGDGTTSTAQDPVHTFPSTGIYTVCLTANVPGCGPQMNCQNINVILTDNHEDNQKTDINVYPNPFTNEFNLNYFLKEKASITIEIYNTMGQKIETIVNSDQAAGEYKYSLNANQKGFDAGIYFVKYSLNGKTTIKKVVAIK